jgi:hypothetical protein
MADIVWQDVVDEAKELANPKVAIGAQTVLLAWANGALNVRVWGGEDSAKLKLARALMVAHIATLIGQRGAAIAGPVTSESEGGVSRSYAQISSATRDPNWAATAYGQAYLTILSTTMARLPFVPGGGRGGGLCGPPFGGGFQ